VSAHHCGLCAACARGERAGLAAVLAEVFSGERFGSSPFAPACSQRVVGRSSLEAGEDAQVPDDNGAGQHHEVLGAPEQAAPTSTHVSGGGIFERRKAAFDSCATRI